MEDQNNPTFSVPGPVYSPETTRPEYKQVTKRRMPVFVSGILAFMLVLGGAVSSFYFIRAINKAPVPTSPASKPRAAECVINAPTGLTVEKTSPTSVKLKWTPGSGGNYVKMWVSTDPNPTGNCSILASKTTNATCVVNENTDNGLPAVPSVYTVGNLTPNTTYYWRMMMWSYSGCDHAAEIVSFKTDVACSDTSWIPDPATICKNETFEQTSNCGAKRIIPGTKNCVVTQACTDMKIYKKNSDGTFSSTPMTSEELAGFTTGDTLRLTVKSSTSAAPVRFRVSLNGETISLPGPIVWPEAPNQRPAQGYVDTETKFISYYDFTATKPGTYKFEGFVKAKP